MLVAEPDIELYQGDDYAAADGRALTFTAPAGAGWPDLTTASITLTLRSITTPNRLAKSGTAVSATEAQVELTGTDTAGLDPVLYDYTVDAVVATRIITIARGRCRVHGEL